LSDYGDASRLIRFGLEPTLFADRDEDYRVLLRRYRTDLGFQDIVREIAENQGLKIENHNEWQVILSARLESPYLFNMSEWRRRSSVGYQDRLLYGLIAMAIAACYYPTSRSLEEEHHRPLNAEQVDAFIRSAAEARKRRALDEDDTLEYTQAWKIYERGKSVKTGKRSSQTATQDMIKAVFEFLAERGLVRKMKGTEAYQPLYRFQAMMSGTLSHYAYAEMARLRREMTGEATDV